MISGNNEKEWFVPVLEQLILIPSFILYAYTGQYILQPCSSNPNSPDAHVASEFCWTHLI